jgi:hypothetical protein
MLAFSLMDYLIQSHSNALDYAAGGFKDFSRIVGVRITRLLLNKLPSAATTPFCSLPAMGCAGINLGGMAPNTSLAVAITLPLVLPTSQIIIRSLMCGF